ncbi:hypothetical protein B0E34_15480 [Chryseobacterium mucoviscidosis]|uniref:Uncharacterized protein n=1 Tax=Chryseobacterium mucoviscidosis TaxID=1945581 RepID=A0A202BWA2_9FLAO|nr:hypothetical protein B0E34_15480 [Chryseobacterium mucoviscidosis]
MEIPNVYFSIKTCDKLISELTTKGTKDNVKANFQNNQSAQKNKNQRFLKTIVTFFINLK